MKFKGTKEERREEFRKLCEKMADVEMPSGMLAMSSYPGDRERLLERVNVDPRSLSDEEFHELIGNAFWYLALDDGDIADGLRVSIPTVHRWQEGKNLPHPGFRPAVLRFIRRCLENEGQLEEEGEND